MKVTQEEELKEWQNEVLRSKCHLILDFPLHSSQRLPEFLCPSSVFQSSTDDLGFFSTAFTTSLF